MSLSKKVRSFEYTQKWQIQYLHALKYIKKHEGYSPIKYYCAAGKPTIGYGHIVLNTEHIPNILNRKQADLLLRKDFNRALRLTEHALPKIHGSKKIAVAHFIFALGIGRFLRSDLRKTIINKDSTAIDSVWLTYCNYHVPSGKKIRSEYALKMREWELKMFKQ